MTKRADCRFLFVFLACLFLPAVHSAAQTRPANLPGGHRGAVTALLSNGYGTIFSAGEDGFVGAWYGHSVEERYQISRYRLLSFVLRPGYPHIAVVESGGIDLYRVSVWNYETRENLFTLRFRDPVTYINYSAAGSFLIVARSGVQAGVVFIHPETGAQLESPGTLFGHLVFAATGHTERVMICYLSSGIISYWDVATGSELHRFAAPPNIRSPVLFGNNRFLGGFDSQGLIIVDATTGLILARNNALNRGNLFGFSDIPDARGFIRFYCLSFSRGVYAVYRKEINLDGRLNTLNRRAIPERAGQITYAIMGDDGNIVLGTAQGDLWLLSGNTIRAKTTGTPLRIIDVAACASAIAFISESGATGYIPLDFSRFNNGSVLTLESAGAYTRVISDSSRLGQQGDYRAVSRFLFWQPGAAHSSPRLKTLTGSPKDAVTSQVTLDQLPWRFPVRSADIMGNSVLLLNTANGALVLNRESGALRFSQTVPGAMDAAFIDEDTIIFARSSAAGNTPFLMINISTGETVPLAYPAIVGTRVYRGRSGEVYGAVINQVGDMLQTAIIRLNRSAPMLSERLIEYGGEDSYFTMTESGGNMASTLGSGAAILYRRQGIVALERCRGLPVRIVNGGYWFITLDGDGGITWHDNMTGKLLAVFRLKRDLWVLERNGELISGRIAER